MHIQPLTHNAAHCPQAGALPPAAFTEALGCFASLDIPGHDYATLLRSTSLPAFLAQLAAGAGAGGGTEEDAILLEVVHAVGVLCADAECAEMLAVAGLVSWEAEERVQGRGEAIEAAGAGATDEAAQSAWYATARQ